MKKKKNTDINKEKWVKGQMGESQNTDSEEGRKIDNILQCRYTCTIITTQGGLAFKKRKCFSRRLLQCYIFSRRFAAPRNAVAVHTRDTDAVATYYHTFSDGEIYISC